MERVAFISVHGCPNSGPGGKDSGGMNVYLHQVSKELSRKGLNVDIYTRRHDPGIPEVVRLWDGVRVIHIEAGPLSGDKESLPNHLPHFVCSVLDYAHKERLSYDLVHSHYWLSGRVGTVLSHRWGVPHVASFHTLAEIKRRARVGEMETRERILGEGKVIAAADRIVAFSKHEKEAMVRLYDANPNKLDVIPCGVDVELFRPMDRGQARKKLGLEANNVVLYVGRIDPIKGVDILLKAVAQLEDLDSVKVLIIGGDDESDVEMRRLQFLTSELGISSQVNFLGTLNQRKLPLYYNAADVCVIPSYYESFGLVALEAMACSTPVIASRVGGLQTIVRDGVTGYLVQSRCPEPFTDALDVLFHSNSMRIAMGRASRTRAKTLAWSQVADMLIDLYGCLDDHSVVKALVD